jgi:hypothetical protein
MTNFPDAANMKEWNLQILASKNFKAVHLECRNWLPFTVE